MIISTVDRSRVTGQSAESIDNRMNSGQANNLCYPSDGRALNATIQPAVQKFDGLPT